MADLHPGMGAARLRPASTRNSFPADCFQIKLSSGLFMSSLSIPPPHHQEEVPIAHITKAEQHPALSRRCTRHRLCPTTHRCTGPTSAPLAKPHPATVPRSRGPTHPTGLLQPPAVAASRRAPASASPAPSSSSDSSSGHLPSRTPPAPLPHCTWGGLSPGPLCPPHSSRGSR